MIESQYLDLQPNGQGVYFPKERRLATSLFLVGFSFFAVVTVIGTLFRGPAWQLMWWPH